MDIVTFLSLLTLFYGMIYFIDQFLKSCLNVPYLIFLENIGLKIQPLQINVFSTIFNRSIAKLAFSYKKTFKIWFSIGVVVVLLLIVPSFYLLIRNVFSQFRPNASDQKEPLLKPIIPGVNLAIEEFPYYFLTLLLASVIHEAGHAIAAACEDVHLNGFGFLFFFMLPAAYVDFPRDGICSLSPFRQLKILCAGVWHNIVLMILALILGLSLPTLLQPFYFANQGISVFSIEKNSPVQGPRGLFKGDVIEMVNFCPTLTVADWQRCLARSISNPQIGFCIPEKVVNQYDETIQNSFVRSDGSVECCDHTDGSSKLCFELQNDDTVDVGETPMHPYSCLPARKAVTSSWNSCWSSSECGDDGVFCLSPTIRNTSRFLAIVRGQSLTKDANSLDDFVLFLGSPSELYFSTHMTNYQSRWSWLPLHLPHAIEVMADYLVKVSGALGLLNLIPCIYLDGDMIARAVVDLALAGRCNPLVRKGLYLVITAAGTFLLVVTLGGALWEML